MPAPTWLVDNIVPNGSLVGLFGPSGSFKSFQAIDIAMSVGTGLPWQGHPVERGLAVYISAEGGIGVGKRGGAWLKHRGVSPNAVDIAWLIESVPINPNGEEMDILLRRVAEMDREPSLVVIDTLARCFDGNENETEDMNRFVAGVDHLRHTLNCAVIVVHHTRLDGSRERGNTAFRGATDTMIEVKRNDDLVTLECVKQRDSEHFEDIELEMLRIEGTGSVVFGPTQAAVRQASNVDSAVEKLRQIQPAPWDTWIAATGLTSKQFSHVFSVLKRNNLVVKNGNGWMVQP